MLKWSTNVQKLQLLLLYAIIGALGQIQPLELDLPSSKILNSQDYIKVAFFAKGGKNPYTFTFSAIPAEWVAVENSIYIPKFSSAAFYQNLIRIQVQDSNNQQINVSVIAVTDGQQLYLDNTIFPYNLTLKMADLQPISTKLQTESDNIQAAISEIIEKQKNQPPSFYQSIDNIYFQLPTIEQINQIIITNNYLALVKTINNVLNSKLNCIQQIAYLSEVNGRIVSLYSTRRKRLQTLLSNSTPIVPSKLISLTLEDLNKIAAGLYRDLINGLALLKQNYQKYNDLFQQILKERQQLVLMKITLDQLQSERDLLIKGISDLKLKSVGVSSNQERNQLKSTIALKQADQLALSNKIAASLERIKKKESLISDLEKQSDNLKIENAKKQVEIEKIQKNIDENQIKLLSLQQQMLVPEIKAMGQIEQTAAMSTMKEENQLRSEIAILQNNLPQLQRTIDEIYYKCYGLISLGVAQVDNKTGLYIYSLSYPQFLNYVRQAYGVAAGSATVTLQKVTLKQANVLSSIWTQNFGSVLESSSPSSQYFEYFSCSSQTTLETRTSFIVSIKANIIKVYSEIEFYYLLLGACSRVELTGDLPKTGGSIFWRGKKVNNNIYDAYFVLIL